MLHAALKARFDTVYDAWAFFDKQGTWNVTTNDFLRLCFALLIDADGLDAEDLVGLVVPSRAKLLDPHEFVKHSCWHDLPQKKREWGDGKEGGVSIVMVTRALDEAKTRRKAISEQAFNRAYQEHPHIVRLRAPKLNTSKEGRCGFPNI